MLNKIWFGMIIVAVCSAIVTGHLAELVNSVTAGASLGFEMALKLTGVMAFWLGLMNIAKDSGIMQHISRLVGPIMTRLFPEIPNNSKAMDAVLLNVSANILGLGNAATPFGLKAMAELQKLNKLPAVATDSMCMLLAINTSSIQLVPITGMLFLSDGGAATPQDIIATTLLATICSTVVAIFFARFFAKSAKFSVNSQKKASL